MVPAKCPQCGAAIELNEKNDAGVCPYCGTTFVMREAVNNYNTYVTANISADRENGDALLGILKEQTDKDYENVCRPLYEAGMLSELRASAEKIIADSPASPVGYKYMIMSFPEYKYRGTDKYNETLGEHLAKDAETHPIAQYYVIMKNLLDTDEQKEKYKTVTSTAARIIEDYDKTVIGFFKKNYCP